MPLLLAVNDTAVVVFVAVVFPTAGLIVFLIWRSVVTPLRSPDRGSRESQTPSVIIDPFMFGAAAETAHSAHRGHAPHAALHQPDPHHHHQHPHPGGHASPADPGHQYHTPAHDPSPPPMDSGPSSPGGSFDSGPSTDSGGGGSAGSSGSSE